MPALPTKRPSKSELAVFLDGGLAWIARQLLLGKAVRKTTQLWDIAVIPFHISSPLLWEAGTVETVLRVSPSYFCTSDPSVFDHQHTHSLIFLY